VDGQTSRTLNADGTTWNVLLPECDGDVSDLEGVKPFDRMLFIAGESPAAWKSTFTVWGANHNFYNTEWQQTDSSGCQLHSPIFNITATGSPEQRQSGLFGLLAFVRGNIGMFANEAFSRNFNPQFALPPVITSVTRTDRGYSDSPRLVRVIDDFDRPTGQSSNGVPTDVNRVSVTNGTISEHDPVQRSGAITWPAGGGSGAPFFETDLIVPGKGVNIRAYKTLNLRLDNQNNATSPTSFRVALAAANGALSTPVWINKYVDLRGPVGGPGGIHRMLQTARIPLRDFRHIRLKAVRGVRLIFNGTPSGAIYAANIRLSKINGVEFKHATHEEAENVEINEITRPSLRVSEQSEKEALVNPERVSQLPAVERPPRVISAGNAIVIRLLNTIDVLSGQPGVEIELISQEPFPVRNALPVLRIGKQEFLLSRYPESGETTRLIFTLTRQEFDQVSSGDEVSLQYGRGRADTVWTFGRLDK